MTKQPEFTKYLPLEDWFRKQPATKTQIKLTFDQVEAILGNPLPKSAIKLKTWWTNVQRYRVIAQPGSTMVGR